MSKSKKLIKLNPRPSSIKREESVRAATPVHGLLGNLLHDEGFRTTTHGLQINKETLQKLSTLMIQVDEDGNLLLTIEED